MEANKLQDSKLEGGQNSNKNLNDKFLDTNSITKVDTFSSEYYKNHLLILTSLLVVLIHYLRY